MRRRLAMIAALALMVSPALAGETEVKAAQNTIESQIDAFLAGDNDTAYSFAAPGIKRLFPTLDQFMAMVTSGYQPVWHPRSFAFGQAEEPSADSIVQHVLLVGPDGKDYEAVYTLERQPDGVFRITGVSLRGTKALST